MEILHGFCCFGWEGSGGCSTNFIEVNVLGVGCELDSLSMDSDNCWCPSTSATKPSPKQTEKCRHRNDIPWRTRSYRREVPEVFEPLQCVAVKLNM